MGFCRRGWPLAASPTGQSAGWSGPFARVGDSEGRLFWRDARGDSIAFTLTGLGAARDDPARLRLTPTPRAERELAR